MRHLVQISSLLLFVCVLALVAACENKTPRPKTEASAGPSAAQVQVQQVAATEERQSRKDAELTDKVKTALGPQAESLDIDSNAGVVRIKGQVDSDQTKQKVQEAAKAVPGVRWVQDQTSVKPEAAVSPEAKK